MILSRLTIRCVGVNAIRQVALISLPERACADIYADMRRHGPLESVLPKSIESVVCALRTTCTHAHAPRSMDLWNPAWILPSGTSDLLSEDHE